MYFKSESMTLDITYRCPFRCPGCIEEEAMGCCLSSDLGFETACDLISDFSALGGRQLRLYGGEPTAHPEFPEILQHATQTVESLRVVTNGAFLHRSAVAQAVREAAANADFRIRISLNAGTAKTHEAVHRATGYFDRVVAGMKAVTSGGSGVRLGVSFLLEDANATEIVQAYEIAREVGAVEFQLRPKTGTRAIGVVPLKSESRWAALAAIKELRLRASAGLGPGVDVVLWHLQYLATEELPDTGKSYEACYYCGGCRIVVTPPNPGVVWGCPYWRADARFHIANLSETPLSSEEFQQRRLAAFRRVHPPRDCAKVICDCHEANQAWWAQTRRASPVGQAA